MSICFLFYKSVILQIKIVLGKLLKELEKRLIDENKNDGNHEIIGPHPIDWINLVIIDCYTRFAKRYDDYLHGIATGGEYYS